MTSAIEALDERLECLAALKEVAGDGVQFTSGAPGPAECKDVNDILLNATKQMLGAEPDLDAFVYGPEQGCETFRNELANFLTEQYGDSVSSSNLMVTAGAAQGLHLVLSVLSEKSAPILVEDPTYFLALRIFQKDFEREVIPVTTDETGMDLDDLDKKLSSLKRPPDSDSVKDRYHAIVYVMTAFSNPGGFVYSSGKCEQLTALARKHDVLVVVDDVYNLLWFPSSSSPSSEPSKAPPRLVSFDRASDRDYGRGHVVSVGSFSKYLAPGIRLGWLEAPEKVLARLYTSGVSTSGGSFNHYMSRLVTCALRSGSVTRHLAGVRLDYKNRVHKLCDLLDKHLPKGCSFSRPQGGFYVWLQFPVNIDTFEFAQFSAERYGVIFLPGVLTSPSEECRNFARLSVSSLDEAKIETGVRELCLAIKDYVIM
ncbi:hypothetical protein EGW08_001011 [Elysia chlorotica]|uniref:Aminotransferase class I/classII large domain-containing protein n=1 Tax=Elysia chlorotica TaxID=188477 RepID=A0A433UBI8_ELYCH|nr:hypothetical protein EGW08_001011 [Elysia chlorotica]